VRSYSSTDPVANPHPALDPAAYTKLCQERPSTPNCGVPLYWQAPPIVLGTGKGMHRFSWDMHFQPITTPDGEIGGGDDAQGAVPGHMYPDPHAPWAPAGNYTVRLTAGGTRYTQPLTVKMDPRVKTSSADLTRLATMSRSLYDDAVQAYAAYTTARALSAKLAGESGSDAAAFKAQLDSIAPPAATGPRGFGGGRGGAAAAPTLESASTALLAAAMGMQSADVAPTGRDVAAGAGARAGAFNAMARWNRLRTSGLASLNAKRKAAGQPPITLP
jgi:hypothetical protein